jgi:hypothetical protein
MYGETVKPQYEVAQKFQMGKIDISLNGKTIILISWLEVKNG